MYLYNSAVPKNLAAFFFFFFVLKIQPPYTGGSINNSETPAKIQQPQSKFCLK